MGAFFHLSYTALEGNSKIRILTSGTLSQTSDLQNHASAYQSSKRVIDLAEEGECSEHDKLDRHRSTRLTIQLTTSLLQVIIKLCLQISSIMRVYQRQLILVSSCHYIL